MNDKFASVDLGFAKALMPPGTHICQIFCDDDERNDSLLRFLLRGLQTGECNACFSENISEEHLKEYFALNGISLNSAQQSGALTLSTTKNVYFQDGRFDPERMLNLLTQYHENSVKAGFPAARVIGEMTSDIADHPGGSRLLEYESRVSLLLREHPVTAVCQYDARTFDGATIMDVLKVHPLMVVRGAVVQNPYYIPPEEYLRQCCESC